MRQGGWLLGLVGAIFVAFTCAAPAVIPATGVGASCDVGAPLIARGNLAVSAIPADVIAAALAADADAADAA